VTINTVIVTREIVVVLSTRYTQRNILFGCFISNFNKYTVLVTKDIVLVTIDTVLVLTDATVVLWWYIDTV